MTLEDRILAIQSETIKRANKQIKYHNTPLALIEFANILEQVKNEADNI